MVINKVNHQWQCVYRMTPGTIRHWAHFQQSDPHLTSSRIYEIGFVICSAKRMVAMHQAQCSRGHGRGHRDQRQSNSQGYQGNSPCCKCCCDTMIKATAKPVISSVMPAMNEDTSGSLHDNNCTHHQGNDWGYHGGNGRGYRQSRGRGGYRNQQVYNAVLNDDYRYYYKYPLQEQFDNLQADDVFKQKFWHVRWTCS